MRSLHVIPLMLTAGAAAQPLVFTGLSGPLTNQVESGAMGFCVAGMADVTGDGRGDFVTGAPGQPAGTLTEAGRVYLWSGSTAALVRAFVSPNAEVGSRFGEGVASIPDCTGDGKPDLVIGAPGEKVGNYQEAGRAYIYNGVTGAIHRALLSNDPVYYAGFGAVATAVPDVNGDGRWDVVIGAPDDTPNNTPVHSGCAYLFSGASGNLLRVLKTPHADYGRQFGNSVAGIQDLNGDGRGDIVIGAAREDALGLSNSGRVHIYSGATGAWLRTIVSPANEMLGDFGRAVAALPDLTGDGRGEILVGAPGESPGTDPSGTGRAYIFNGATGALVRKVIPAWKDIGMAFGYSVAVLPDRTGDGVAEYAVGSAGSIPGKPADSGAVHVYNGATGARLFSFGSPNGEFAGYFGRSIASVPDTNADGKADFIVGARNEDPGTSPAGAGRAYRVR